MFDLSIVLPTRNRADQLLKALMGIERGTHCSYEVIVVDGASTDATDGVLMLAGSIMGPRLRVIREGTRVGFAMACNKGIGLARGRYACVLHDDVHPLDGALSEGVAQLDSLCDDHAVLTLFAPPAEEIDAALDRTMDGRRFAVSHVRGTLVAPYPMAARRAFGSSPFDRTLTTSAATIEFSLRAWDAGYRIVPASRLALDQHFAEGATDPKERAELETVLSRWNLPGDDTRFNPMTPCTLRGARSRRAA